MLLDGMFDFLVWYKTQSKWFVERFFTSGAFRIGPLNLENVEYFSEKTHKFQIDDKISCRSNKSNVGRKKWIIWIIKSIRLLMKSWYSFELQIPNFQKAVFSVFYCQMHNIWCFSVAGNITYGMSGFKFI